MCEVQQQLVQELRNEGMIHKYLLHRVVWRISGNMRRGRVPRKHLVSGNYCDKGEEGLEHRSDWPCHHSQHVLPSFCIATSLPDLRIKKQ